MSPVLVEDLDAIEGVLVMHVVTTKTKDHGDKFVLRRHGAGRSGETYVENRCMVFDTLEKARESIPHGAYNVGRAPEDDSVIVEAWV